MSTDQDQATLHSPQVLYPSIQINIFPTQQIMNQQEDQALLNSHIVPHPQPPPYHATQSQHPESRSSRSRSRSKSREHRGHHEPQEPKNIQVEEPYNNEEREPNGNGLSIDNDLKDKPSLKKGSSKVIGKEIKKKRAPKLYMTDFSDYLPEALIYVTRTNITSKIRIGERYQALVPANPPLLSLYRPMQQWLVWGGSSSPEEKPTEEHIRRFKEVLGGSRNEEQLIGMRDRLNMKSWNEVIVWAQGRKSELRWKFHQNQKNRPV